MIYKIIYKNKFVKLWIDFNDIEKYVGCLSGVCHKFIQFNEALRRTIWHTV